MIAAVIAIVALTALFAYREWQHAAQLREAAEERAQLLNRIQAPDVAVAESLDPDFDGLAYVPIDDDKAFQAEMERIEDG